jgi:hypothetical protein
MKQARSNVMRFFKTLLGNQPKEESLTIIFKPLNGIEEKVKIRKQIIEEKILELKDNKEIIDNQIETYGLEISQCNMYLDNVNKFT